MTLYSVLAPPTTDRSTRPDPARFVFVKEGFCWPAVFLPVLWPVWRGLWLVLIGYLALLLGVLAFFAAAPAAIGWTGLVLFSLLVGLEANNLRRWTLERRGYRPVGLISGDRLGEAEYRFFAGWGRPAGDRPAAATRPPPAPRRPAPGDTGIVGLFPVPGARP